MSNNRQIWPVTSAAFSDPAAGGRLRHGGTENGLNKCRASFILRFVAPKLRLLNRKQVYPQISLEEI